MDWRIWTAGLIGSVIGGLLVRLVGYTIEKRIERRQANPTPEEAEKTLQTLEKEMLLYSSLAQNPAQLIFDAVAYNATISTNLNRIARFHFFALLVIAVVLVIVIAVLTEATWVGGLAAVIMFLFFIADFPLLLVQDNLPPLKRAIRDIHRVSDIEAYKDRNLAEQRKMRRFMRESSNAGIDTPGTEND